MTLPTQVVTSQAPQSELGAAARAASIQSPVADATLATGIALVSANTSQMPATVQAAVSAPGDMPKCRLVTRLNQPGLTVQQGYVGSSETAGGRQAAPRADPGAHQGPAGLPNEATEATAAAVEQGLHPRVSESSREACTAATAAERGKRPADGSPAVSGADKAAHKRARSNSPIAAKLKEQGKEPAGRERIGPSDADVQVSPPYTIFVSRWYTLMCPQPKTSQG